MKLSALVLAPLLAALVAPAAAQVNTIKRVRPIAAQTPVPVPAGKSGIVVQGGLQAQPSGPDNIIVQGGLQPRPSEAIGPKQDDPLTSGCGPGMSPVDGPVDIVRPGGEGDPHAGHHGVEAIGPKQDDPGRPGTLAIGPKQDDPGRPGTLAIGPKQDDPGRPGTLAIGPKQDDPGRPGTLAIGPKQDDPRTRGTVSRVGRPGDDNDPKARCVPTAR